MKGGGLDSVGEVKTEAETMETQGGAQTGERRGLSQLKKALSLQKVPALPTLWCQAPALEREPSENEYVLL